MSEWIDHAAEASDWLADAPVELHEAGLDSHTAECAALCVGMAQAEATLALVEQQRIANLIALSQAMDGNGWQASEPLGELFAYTHPDPEDGFKGLHIRPEIAAALVIGVSNGATGGGDVG